MPCNGLDIYEALQEGLQKISMYQKLFWPIPRRPFTTTPKESCTALVNFARSIPSTLRSSREIYDDMILKKDDLFITIQESDLVNLVKQIRERKMVLGGDIGLISHNDTPLKELLGITVISTDFKAIGETAASMILNKETGRVKNKFRYIDRDLI